MVGCIDNLVSKTVVVVLSATLVLLGVALTGVGVYAYVKHKNDPFFDAFLEDGFEKETALTYIGELRLGNYNEDLRNAYLGFQKGFGEKFIRETIVKKAFHYRKTGEENIALSFWLEGFRDFALCETDCSRSNRTSADIIAEYVNARTKDIDAIGNAAGSLANAGISVTDGVRKISERVRRLFVATTIPTRRVEQSLQVNQAGERRRNTVTVQVLTGADVANAADNTDGTNTDGNHDGAETDSQKDGGETTRLTAGEKMTEEEEDAYNAGYDTAQVIADFALNWVVCVIFGAVLLVLGCLSCKALTQRWIAALLCLCLWFLGVFCFLQYGQSQGWEFCEKWLSKMNLGGVVMTAEENLRKNETTELALQSLLGFYKPWYLIIASVVFVTLGSMYMKLACSSNLSTGKGEGWI